MFIWDENKSDRNKSKHGLAFDAVNLFDWKKPVIVDRSRHADGEQRFAAIGMLGGKLHTVVFTHRADDVRIISLRRANKSEERTYAQKN
jgi:uncharacterized DUF497 family protein